MDDDPDAYVKTISQVLKDPRQDKKIISNVVKEISINWKYITLAIFSMHEVILFQQLLEFYHYRNILV